jgi:hypothetical protein
VLAAFEEHAKSQTFLKTASHFRLDKSTSSIVKLSLDLNNRALQGIESGLISFISSQNFFFFF